MTWRLFADTRRERLAAIRALSSPPDDAAAFALRRVLFTDRDAHVRTAAARALGALPPGSAAESWLVERIDDRAPLVRDAIVRALARCGTGNATAAIRTVIETDSVWWVRRSAVFALATLPCGEPELATFTRTLADPFWRVRQAAVRVLSLLGARDPEVRDAVVAAPPSSTVAFLRGTWGPVAVEAPARATASSQLPPALQDPDPAVVTARLARDREVTPMALVELLCDPHAPLRELAARRLAATGDVEALAAALDWLEEVRIPHVADTVIELLDGLGDPALSVAERALARPDRPAGVRWAIDWVVAARAETLYDAAIACADGDLPHAATWRAAALPLASDDDLVRWAADATLVDDIAAELHERRAWDELAQLPADRPRTRTLQIDAAARRSDPAWARVEAGLDDPHPGPRAVAARWLVRHAHRAPADLARDPDPVVREAALSAIVVEHGRSALPAAIAGLDDPDALVRRMAIRATAIAARDIDSSSDPSIDPLIAATVDVAGDPDPMLRRTACELPLFDDTALAAIVGLTADRDPGVRAAAADALERLFETDARVRALVESSSTPAAVRRLGYQWLLRRLDEAAIDLARAAYDRETDPELRSVFLGVITSANAPTETAVEAAPDEIAAAAMRESEATPTEAATASPAVERRPFGRAGFDVAPLAISGAFDLSHDGLAAAQAAGVDLTFWEPGYDVLARFLRTRPSMRVVSGTYHADETSIRSDVHRALRVLRRDTLDAFLLFWTRSSARLDDAAFGALAKLKREGKIRAIGFSTHHRDLAREAIETRPWDVVMIRHSAAHPGIETDVLPTARAHGTAILTFSALCYGRLLSGPGAPSPAECYRYSLAQPGVTACISAPRRFEELVENLGALAEPHLPAARIEELRRHGIGVRAESQRVNTLLRQPTRDAAAAAREMLASEPPPDRELHIAPAMAIRSRARLGRRRR